MSNEREPLPPPDTARKRRGVWARLKAWFAKEPGRHDSYVSNVTNPDDRRFIPRR